MYCNLLPRSRLLNSTSLFCLIHKIIESEFPQAEHARQLARNEHFFRHLLLVLSQKLNSGFTYSALRILRKLILNMPYWKEYVCNEGGIRILLSLIHFDKHEKRTIRCCALFTLIRLITPANERELLKTGSKFTNEKARIIFIENGGVEVFFTIIFNLIVLYFLGNGKLYSK